MFTHKRSHVYTQTESCLHTNGVMFTHTAKNCEHLQRVELFVARCSCHFAPEVGNLWWMCVDLKVPYRSVCPLRTYFCTSQGRHTSCVWSESWKSNMWHLKLLHGIGNCLACQVWPRAVGCPALSYVQWSTAVMRVWRTFAKAS